MTAERTPNSTNPHGAQSGKKTPNPRRQIRNPSGLRDMRTQQTFSRMWHLKLSDPMNYAWVVPCSGDFHYQFHVASGVHRVAHAPILQWFVNETNMPKTVKKQMDDTCHMKYIDHFTSSPSSPSSPSPHLPHRCVRPRLHGQEAERPPRGEQDAHR